MHTHNVEMIYGLHMKNTYYEARVLAVANLIDELVLAKADPFLKSTRLKDNLSCRHYRVTIEVTLKFERRPPRIWIV